MWLNWLAFVAGVVVMGGALHRVPQIHEEKPSLNSSIHTWEGLNSDSDVTGRKRRGSP